MITMSENVKLPFKVLGIIWSLFNPPSLYRIYASVYRVSIGSDDGLSPYSAPSPYLNQWWVSVNWTIKNKPQWRFNQNTNFSLSKMYLKRSYAKWRSFCSGGDELMQTRLGVENNFFVCVFLSCCGYALILQSHIAFALLSKLKTHIAEQNYVQ